MTTKNGDLEMDVNRLTSQLEDVQQSYKNLEEEHSIYLQEHQKSQKEIASKTNIPVEDRRWFRHSEKL